MDGKQIALKGIEEITAKAEEISDKIWGYAELSLKEFKSTELYVKELKAAGFKVTENLAGIKTCFKGEYGSGRPYIGILAEFDALSGLSQKGGQAVKEEIVKDGCGHGCGHNLLGAGSFAAAYGIKKYLEQTKSSGTVIFYGCPGEEGGAGKAFMARDNMWCELDAALTWHPDDSNKVATGTCVSCIQKEYTFKGIAAHASGNPEKGRSALDAVELMNIGVQFLREHMNSTARIHYSITNAGGNSPNVVQPIAKVLYMVRDVEVGEALELQKRVDKIAEAAAMMTETTYSVQFIDGTANTVPNKVLEETYYQNFISTKLPEYSKEEKELVENIVKSYEMPATPLSDSFKDDEELYKFIDNATAHGTKAINDFVVPYKFANSVLPGSTDVGDVSWQTPTAQIYTACFAAGAPGHSWQNVALGNTSFAHKGVILAAQVMAKTAVDLFEKPEVLKAAKEEFKFRAKKGYTCPIPKDAVPVAID